MQDQTFFSPADRRQAMARLHVAWPAAQRAWHDWCRERPGAGGVLVIRHEVDPQGMPRVTVVALEDLEDLEDLMADTPAQTAWRAALTATRAGRLPIVILLDPDRTVLGSLPLDEFDQG